jgi:hypothetical protein
MNTDHDQKTNAAGLTDDQRKAIVKCHHEANVIEETFGAGIVASISGSSLASHAGPGGFKVYRDRVLAASGAPKDPIEAMLIEQLLWAHHRLADLHVTATAAKETDQVSALTSAAARLMAEFRKSSLALREYRSPTMPKQVTLVKQQNVAAGNQQVAMVEADAAGQLPVKRAGDSELGSKQKLVAHAETTPTFPTAARREAEPAQTTRTDTGRPEAFERSSPPEPALVALHRA